MLLQAAALSLCPCGAGREVRAVVFNANNVDIGSASLRQVAYGPSQPLTDFPSPLPGYLSRAMLRYGFVNTAG